LHQRRDSDTAETRRLALAVVAALSIVVMWRTRKMRSA